MDTDKFYERLIVIIFLPINLNMCLGAHNICFGWEIKKIVFQYTLLSGGLSLYESCYSFDQEPSVDFKNKGN